MSGQPVYYDPAAAAADKKKRMVMIVGGAAVLLILIIVLVVALKKPKDPIAWGKACDSDSDCVPGASGKPVCANVRGTPGLVCCASGYGKYNYGESRTYCTDMPKGTQCWPNDNICVAPLTCSDAGQGSGPSICQ